MSIFSNTALRAVVVGLITGLCGCIGSPFGPGAVASLYRWDDRESAIATRVGEASQEQGGYFNGDFNFTDVLESYPGLEDSPDAPLLMRACQDEICYSLVVFGDLFEKNADGLVTGYASMTALSTAMANQVLSLPPEEVRAALDILAGRLRADGLADYGEFLKLDPERRLRDERKLTNDRLMAAADELLESQPDFDVNDLLGLSSTRTEDLYVPEGFLFDDSTVIAIDVDVSRSLAEPAYLLVCNSFEETEEGYEVDYGDCQLNTPLTSGAFQGEIKLTGGTTELLAIILPMKNPDDARYSRWSQGQDGSSFRVR